MTAHGTGRLIVIFGAAWFALIASAQSRAAAKELHLLVLGNTQNDGMAPLEHAKKAIEEWKGRIDTVAYVPFASSVAKHSTDRAREPLGKLGLKVVEVTPDENGIRLVKSAQAIYVGGGNTFRLLKALQKSRLLEPIRERVLAGVPFLGSSAGANLVSPTIQTTNDMPVAYPDNPRALNLLPFQINCHFFDSVPGMPGETREERILDFFPENSIPVLALRQGAWLTVEGRKITLGGARARLFLPEDAKQARPPVRELEPGTSFGPDLRAFAATISR